MDLKPDTLFTQRLVLRPLTAADAEAMQAYSENPRLSEMMTWEPHLDVVASLNFIESVVLPAYKRKIPRALGLALKARPEEIIGTMGVDWVSEKDECLNLGYVLSESHWGHGYIVEAGLPFITWLFANMQVTRIQATCAVENTRSASVLKKLGMTYEGTLRSFAHMKGRFWDMQMYSILKSEASK